MITTESEGRRSCSGKSPGCTVDEIRLRVRLDLAQAFSNPDDPRVVAAEANLGEVADYLAGRHRAL
jgi:hypothetical protein